MIPVAVTLACGLFPYHAQAQAAPAVAPTVVAAAAPADAAPAAPVAVCAGCIAIPALTPVRIEVLVTLGSKASKSGDTFPIRLAEPIVIDGKEVIPAGTTGMGEVIHAKKPGGSGAPGELVLAARFLDVQGQQLRLRSMHVSPTGRSNINTVHAINMAGAAVPGVSLIGFFITGGQATVPEGTIADAKTAEAFSFAMPVPAPVAATQESAPAPAAQPAS